MGGKHKVKMEDLKRVFQGLGYPEVKTLLASGNVVFSAPAKTGLVLAESIERALEEAFGFKMGVVLRTIPEIKTLVDANPFKGVKVTPQTRLYVTFLTQAPKASFKLPYASPDENFRILRAVGRDLCSVLTVSETGRTVDLMKVLDQEFGKTVTTRNWNTVEKVLKSAQP
ncbi:MAG: DUF1697 domain-containing protein [Candidatus Hydrogenedentes bacterium]|nr:DUF1697 domain-containing protein [Candidatus Hydrogenedentota bacterium]